jgi:hypothetical protein
MRPRQWPKNAFLFAALVFDRQLISTEPLVRTVVGFILLCLASGLVYIINDLVDLPYDRQHPVKRNRPIASGDLPVGAARASAAVLAAVTLAGSLALDLSFTLIVAVYVGSNLLYSFWPPPDHRRVRRRLRLRPARRRRRRTSTVERFSPWLYVCMSSWRSTLVSEALRRDGPAGRGRQHSSPGPDGYTLLLDSYILIVSGTSIVAYSLYTFSAPTSPATI